MRVVRKFVASLAFLAIAVVVVMFAVANRADVQVSLWPLPYEVSLRLSGALLGALAIGIVLGGAISWSSGIGRRRRRRDPRARAPSPEAAEPAHGVDRPPAAELKRLPAAVDRN